MTFRNGRRPKSVWFKVKWVIWFIVVASATLVVWITTWSLSNANRATRGTNSTPISNLPSIIPQDLAGEYPSNGQRFNGSIGLYWSLHSDLFSYINYKSLESILVSYPPATVNIRIIGPEHAEYYKVGNIISKQTFQKYLKQKFRVKVEIRHTNSKLKGRALLPGYKTWRSAVEDLYSVSHITRMREYNPVPFYLEFYDRVASLYLDGGISTDFSWIHMDEATIRDDSVGIVMKILCVGPSPCAVSTFMVAARGHPWLQCVLDQYNSTSALPACLATDNSHGGLHCVLVSMETCFAATRTSNHLSSLAVQCAVMNTSHPTFSLGGHPFCVDYSMQSSPECIWGRCSIGTEDNNAKSAFVWLGKSALDGSWSLPSQDSILYHLIAQNDAYLSEQIASGFPEVTNVSLPHCAHYQSYPTDRAAAATQSRVSCAPSFVIPGFMKAGSSFVFETLMGHPNAVRALRGSQFKETGCYLPQRMTPDLRSTRMNCFPFVEPRDHVIFGDATVYYAQAPKAPHELWQDNPDIKVLFTLRNPISRAESHHHFDYKAYLHQGIPDMNECIALAVEANSLLDQWRAKAVAALEYHRQHGGRLSTATNPSFRQLIDFYDQGIKKKSSFRYFRCGNLILHSLYVLPIHRWAQVIPSANLRVVNSELLDPRPLSVAQKRRGLQQLPALFNESFQHVWPEIALRSRDRMNASKPMKHAKLTELDKEYLAYQFNAIHQFLGLSSRRRMWAGGGHETPVEMPASMRLNGTMRHQLFRYFQPFNELLDVYIAQLRLLGGH